MSKSQRKQGCPEADTVVIRSLEQSLEGEKAESFKSIVRKAHSKDIGLRVISDYALSRERSGERQKKSLNA